MNTLTRTDRAAVRKEQKRIAATVATFPWGALLPLTHRQAQRLWDATAMVASLAHLPALATQIDTTLAGAGWDRPEDATMLAAAVDTIAECIEDGTVAGEGASDWRQRAEHLRSWAAAAPA